MINNFLRTRIYGLQFAKQGLRTGYIKTYFTREYQTTLICSQQAKEESGKDKQTTAKDEAVKLKLLKSALLYVPQYGWTMKSIEAAAQHEGYPQVTRGIFQRGSIELVDYFYSSSNDKLSEWLQQTTENPENKTLSKTLLIRNAVQYRIQMILPYKASWPQAMGLMVLPQNCISSSSYLLDLVNSIWFYAGDRSLNWKWYSKRATLAALYKATELYMIQDMSDGHQNTWHFLDRRIDDLRTFSEGIRQAQKTSDVVFNFIKGSTIVATNIAGVKP